MAELSFQPARGSDERVEVDARFYALPVKRVDEIFGRDVARRIGSERAAARPSDRSVEDGCARLERRHRARDRGVAGVVEVNTDGDIERERACDHARDLARHRNADRVREHDLGGPDRDDFAGEREHAIGRHRPLERTPEGNADRRRRPDPVVGRAPDDRGGRSRGLVDGRVRVPSAEALGRCERHVSLVEPGRVQPVVASLVQDKACVDDARLAVECGDDLFRPRHLRHAIVADEAHRLDPRHARSGQSVAELGPQRRGQGDGLVLETVARPDVADRDAHARS